ncbi:hypothetical protein HDE_01994 [Halotydeus destructor]|nr:hypothetical protein HDE_01994 [Halotydeus destructor]
MVPKWPLVIVLVSLIVPNISDTVDGEIFFDSCEQKDKYCYGGYDKPDQDCIKRGDCDSVLISSKKGSYSTWNLFLLVHINKPTTDQLIFSRQPSHVTSRDAITFETDNPKRRRQPCVFVTLGGTETVCSSNPTYQVFTILPDKGSDVIGPNGAQYVGYRLVSKDVLTYSNRCPKVYFVAPTKEKTSITIRRLQYDDKTVVSELNFDFIDVFGLGLEDGPTKYEPDCYSPPKTRKTTRATPTTTTIATTTSTTAMSTHSSKPWRSLKTQTGGATRSKVRKYLFVTLLVILFVVCAILVRLYLDFGRKGKIKDGFPSSRRDSVFSFTSETQAQ